MGKRVTIKQLAQEAGVSTATVSYVLNDRKDQKITPVVRKKVLQLANLYHYSGNAVAKYLATGRADAVAVYLGQPDTVLGNANAFALYTRLATAFGSMGLRTSLIPSAMTDQLSGFDGIFCVGISSALFGEIGNNNFVPLVAVDGFVDNPWLFYEVVDGYAGESGKRPLVCLPSAAESYMAFLAQHFDVRFVRTFAEADRAAGELAGRPFAVRDPALHRYFAEKGVQTLFLDSLSDRKIEAMYKSLRQAESAKGRAVNQMHRLYV